MSKPQKITTVALWMAAVIAMVGVLALKTLPVDQPPVMYSVPAFSLIDQNNHAVTNAQLAGHPWVADFVFTTCGSICPMMSSRMAQLQHLLPPQVKLVSFSVDPRDDTPAVMADYLQRYHAEPGRWIFLTGDPKTEAAVIAGMKLHFQPASGSDPIQHDSHFVLVDGEGHIRGYYELADPGDQAKLRHDVEGLLGVTLPAVQ